MSTAARTPVEVGVTYLSGEVGPYIWHEFDRERTTADLRAVSAAGLRLLRVHLLWDAFMPTPRRVEDARLRDLERFLDCAAAASLRVIPVLFAQTLGDCIMLPPWAIDVDGSRPGVRAVCDAVVQPGGPRDLYTDPLMADAGMRWIDALLAGFSGHPAIALWDLGHDPATTMRPRRIEHLRAWVRSMSARVHDREERCMLTLGARDLTSARAVRPSMVAEPVDLVGLDLAGEPTSGIDAGADAGAAIFLTQLMQSLSGSAQLAANISVIDTGDGATTRRHTAQVFEGLVDVGCAALSAAAWSAPGARVVEVPPFDRGARAAAVVDASGAESAFGAAWLEGAAEEHERRPLAPWPAEIDSDEYYAHLPESLRDLHVAWQRGAGDHPAMLR